MRVHKENLFAFGIIAVILVSFCVVVFADNISSWDVTLPDGAHSTDATGLNELDDYIRDRSSDFQTAWAIEHADNGTHVLPYGTTTERNAYDDTYGTTGNLFFDSTEGFIYRWSGSAWVRFAPVGVEIAHTVDTSPDADGYDRMIYTTSGSITISEIDDGHVGQTIRILNSGSNDVVIDHTDGGTDNIYTTDAADFTMDTTGDMIVLTKWDDGYWREEGRIEQ